MENNFICCICKQIPHNVVESDCCNSLFCWDCVVKTPSRECPSCIQTLDPELCKENLAIKKIISGIVVNCTFNGCSDSFPVSERVAHEGVCRYRPVLCPNSELCGIIDQENLSRHLILCSHRRVTCNLCEAVVVYSAMQAHLADACEENDVECPNECHELGLVRKDLGEHLANLCGNSEIECPFSQYGCDAKRRRGDMDAHITENISFHVRLISDAFKSQQSQIFELREQLASQGQILSQLQPSPDQRIINFVNSLPIPLLVARHPHATCAAIVLAFFLICPTLFIFILVVSAVFYFRNQH